MTKFMNNKDNYVDDSLSGILKAHSRFLKCAPGNKRAIIRADAPIEGKVAIVTGGGYGHGVGMSQNGAKALGDAGADCRQILEFIFAGCELTNIAEITD